MVLNRCEPTVQTQIKLLLWANSADPDQTATVSQQCRPRSNCHCEPTVQTQIKLPLWANSADPHQTATVSKQCRPTSNCYCEPTVQTHIKLLLWANSADPHQTATVSQQCRPTSNCYCEPTVQTHIKLLLWANSADPDQTATVSQQCRPRSNCYCGQTVQTQIKLLLWANHADPDQTATVSQQCSPDQTATVSKQCRPTSNCYCEQTVQTHIKLLLWANSADPHQTATVSKQCRPTSNCYCEQTVQTHIKLLLWANSADPHQTATVSKQCRPTSNCYCEQTVQTQIKLLLWANSTDPDQTATVCHSIMIYIVWMHYTMVKPPCSNFRVITANFSGVWIFRIFMVKTYSSCWRFDMILLWVSMTPLGNPVVPLEYGKVATSVDGLMSTFSGNSFPSSSRRVLNGRHLSASPSITIMSWKTNEGLCHKSLLHFFIIIMSCTIMINPKFSDRQVWANSEDQIRLLLKVGLHYLPFWTPYSNFRVTTAIFSGVWIFRIFKVSLYTISWSGSIFIIYTHAMIKCLSIFLTNIFLPAFNMIFSEIIFRSVCKRGAGAAITHP